ncbi:N-methylhydantoinase A/oxoprolinase/acetone carboxylase beta subunit [Scopulibacillus darangshiensis]|uniref:N-methylhydantoinase A/oxoprolinase/acetone carboxylase beta subunit n=1 Tax=Scopulibacillus darangshiensis TaxID=442528 RepID=A0A4R2NHY0_9BACL|nr:hydantoinase/oxoprolinase family protein [Scopulibacillus darangshiensis]TCP20785.1 N-methylhydantoinase A/oxoprolinase/acetone carboxylase beta subunit [Scopulibacillus darangshiensis]
MMTYRIGIDVGGTNTDGVLLDREMNVIHSLKTPTTTDVETGIYHAVHQLMKASHIDKEDIAFAMLGTTQCTNAIVERKKLNKVAVIRIGAPAGMAIMPLTGVPEDLRSILDNHTYIVEGGHEFNGDVISALNETELKDIAEDLKGKVDSIAITSIFSPVNKDHESRAEEIFRDVMGDDIAVSLSSEVGSIGLLERENATILNAAIIDVAKTTADGFEKALMNNGIAAKVFFCQNDGTLMSKAYTLKYPILTVACGPTNSLRGASFLTDNKDAIIVDVGGTTTDIGVLVKGFPRQSSIAVELGGVRTNFRMPDINAIGLGGGTIIRIDGDSFKIGPDSVGHRLQEEALVFGGTTLTATDVAVGLGVVKLGNPEKVSHVDKNLFAAIYGRMVEMVEEAIDKIKTSATDAPVILVGGGSVLLPEQIQGASYVLRPENGGVANAIGSAISQISGEIEKIYSISKDNRQEILDKAKQLALTETIEAGADSNKVEIVDMESIPLAYLPGNATRVKVKAAGDLALG